MPRKFPDRVTNQTLQGPDCAVWPLLLLSVTPSAHVVNGRGPALAVMPGFVAPGRARSSAGLHRAPEAPDPGSGIGVSTAIRIPSKAARLHLRNLGTSVCVRRRPGRSWCSARLGTDRVLRRRGRALRCRRRSPFFRARSMLVRRDHTGVHEMIHFRSPTASSWTITGSRILSSVPGLRRQQRLDHHPRLACRLTTPNHRTRPPEASSTACRTRPKPASPGHSARRDFTTTPPGRPGPPAWRASLTRATPPPRRAAGRWPSPARRARRT